jgi:hypothetical protein
LTPSVTTVNQHAEMGKRAAQLLIDRLESNEGDYRIKQLLLIPFLERSQQEVKRSFIGENYINLFKEGFFIKMFYRLIFYSHYDEILIGKRG